MTTTVKDVSPQCRHRDHRGCRWYTYELIAHVPPDFRSLFFCGCECHTEQRACPDQGACHHDCVKACWRVAHCGPLSGVYPNDEWPASVVWLQHSNVSRCYFHGNEQVDETTYRVCLECGHVWTREALEVTLLRELRIERRAEDIFACPECAHDF